MKRKFYWGLGVLAVLLIGVSLGLLIRPTNTGPKDVYIDVDPSKEVVDQMWQQASKKNPPTARPGYKMVPHGDDSHEVPISENPVFQDAPMSTPSVDPHTGNPPTDPEMTYPMPDNPVQTLREYLEKRGHWSAQWIPEFPPEDKEAARLAYNYWVMLQHVEAGNMFYDGPAFIPAQETFESRQHYKFMTTQRSFDIYKLSWSMLESPPGNPENFNAMGTRGRRRGR